MISTSEGDDYVGPSSCDPKGHTWIEKKLFGDRVSSESPGVLGVLGEA